MPSYRAKNWKIVEFLYKPYDFRKAHLTLNGLYNFFEASFLFLKKKQMEKSIASQLLIHVVAEPKSLHKLKPSGNGHYQIQAALGLRTCKERKASSLAHPWGACERFTYTT